MSSEQSETLTSAPGYKIKTKQNSHLDSVVIVTLTAMIRRSLIVKQTGDQDKIGASGNVQPLDHKFLPDTCLQLPLRARLTWKPSSFPPGGVQLHEEMRE